MEYSDEDIEKLDKIINTLAKTSIGTVPEILNGSQEFPAFGSPEDLVSHTHEDILINNGICSVIDGWTPNSVPGGYKTIYLDSGGRDIVRSRKSVIDFLEQKRADKQPTQTRIMPYESFNKPSKVEKYELFDLILDHILTTNQGHSGHIKYSIPTFKDVDQARLDLLLEEMYSIIPGAFDKKPFQGGPALFRNKYTHLLQEEGGFKPLLEKKENEQTARRVIFQKSDSTSPLADLHPRVREVATELFRNGHFYEAILKTYIALSMDVQGKSQLKEDNTPLMRKAFSVGNPVLRVSNDSGEQEGFMHLYEGAMMAIRNPKAHRIIQQNDPQRTLEWLSFASVLFKILEESQKL